VIIVENIQTTLLQDAIDAYHTIYCDGQAQGLRAMGRFLQDSMSAGSGQGPT
jgi:hypothetical protein